jgi:tRNA(Arg) A34 adenosine deaminase TadA
MSELIDSIEQELMIKACNLATLSVQKDSGPFGCVITDMDYNEIASGHNMVTTLNDPTAHAEIVTIREACKKLNNFDLSNCRLFTSCEPCPMCLSAIYWAKLKHVYYANTKTDAKNIDFDDQEIYEEINKDISDRKINMKRVSSNNSMDSFELWAEKTNKIPY